MHHIYKFTIMTSPCEVHLYCSDESKSRAVAKEILMVAKGLEKKYNFYNPDSYLSLLNQRTENKLDRESRDLLSKVKLFYTKTEKIFDVTMGTLTASRKLPTLDAIEKEKERLTPFLGTHHFQIKRDKLIFDNPYTLIDLGGVVKEYAVDQAIKIVKKAKIESALINFGGDIYALGLKPNGRAFSIGIKNPLNPKEYISSIEISNEALTTSASYERTHIRETKEFSHIISSLPLQEEILSATVIASSTLEAGIFSTSFMINFKLQNRLKKILINKNLKIIN